MGTSLRFCFLQDRARADAEPDSQDSMGLDLWLWLISSLYKITRLDKTHKAAVFRYWTVNSPGSNPEEKQIPEGSSPCAPGLCLGSLDKPQQ